MSTPPIFYVSGHLDLTEEEFREHYVPKLEEALKEPGATFVVGDARGADAMAQAWLAEKNAPVTVFHMFVAPRNNVGENALKGGFETDLARDEAMTAASTDDIAWARHRRSNTWKNLERRSAVNRERERNERRGLHRFHVSQEEIYPVYGLHKTNATDDRAVPLPQELYERYCKAADEYHAIQEEIAAWLRKQENDPV